MQVDDLPWEGSAQGRGSSSDRLQIEFSGSGVSGSLLFPWYVQLLYFRIRFRQWKWMKYFPHLCGSPSSFSLLVYSLIHAFLGEKEQHVAESTVMNSWSVVLPGLSLLIVLFMEIYSDFGTWLREQLPAVVLCYLYVHFDEKLGGGKPASFLVYSGV